NDNYIFEDRWVNLHVNRKNNSPWLTHLQYLSLPVRHGEGKFMITDKTVLKTCRRQQQWALLYADTNFRPTYCYPFNPNGSQKAVAGITSSSGLVFGLMPHPEAFLMRENQPGWKNRPLCINKEAAALLQPGDGAGMIFFYNIINHLQNIKDN
ncbi:MAG TPA: phosphoribosylformylglycinamidine synthase subunit PurQ, partial [Spirochaetota bacterium]|nr:phosphoribosylformylglycinamidine synthase subunit PurQ [Spirochaetota bacterium]